MTNLKKTIECKNCYGKGYATWRHGETYRGKTTNMRNDIKFCDCDRGKNLESLLFTASLEAEEWHLSRLIDITNGFKTLDEVKQATLDRLNTLKKQKGENPK